jgi:hypothetical protein
MALGLVAAACGGDDDDDAADSGTAAATDDAGETAADTSATAEESSDMSEESSDMSEESSDMSDDTGDAAGAVDLSADCPSPLVIQTDWFPEAEHGALYELVGEGYTVDSGNLTVTGPLVIDGGTTDTGIEIEVRTGGPAIGFAPPRTQMYTDDAIHIGYSNLDAQIQAWDAAPLIAVMAPLEINPQIIMWDADTYPDVETIADVGTEGITINVFAGGGYMDVFVAEGIWSADQVDPSYDGSPARFIAEGNIAQQGFASAEPYNYEFVFEEYGKAPKYQLLHDAGFETYSQTLAVRPGDLETLRPCLEQFIPIVQQAAVDFAAAPDRANAIVIDAVGQFDSFWVYDEGVANYAVATMNELGLHGNGPDDTIGNLDEARVQKLLDQIRAAGLPVPETLVAEDLYTNEFIDESIGF